MTSLKTQAASRTSIKQDGDIVVAANTAAARQKNQRDNKTRILKQTLVIVLTFLVCWTPYAFAALWYHIDMDSFSKLNQTVSSILYLFAVSNSIINPFIYGKFVKDNPQRV